MTDTTAKYRRRAGIIAVLVGGLLMGGSIFIAMTMSSNEAARLAADHRRIDEAYAARVGAHLEARFSVGEYLARRFKEARPASQREFEEMTAPVRGIFPEFQAINWVNKNLVIQWITPAQGNEKALGLNVGKLPASKYAYEKSAESGELVIAPPTILAQGGRGLVGYFAVRNHEGEVVGALNLVFRIDALLSDAVADLDDGIHRFRLLDDGDVIYSTMPSDTHLKPVDETLIPLPGRSWTIQLFDISRSHERRGSGEYALLLILGILASLSMGGLVYVQVARQGALAASERRFRDFAMLNSDWFWETDVDLRFSYFSERFEEVTGSRKEDLIGHTRSEVGAPGADPEAYAAMLSCMESHRPFFGFEHYRDHPTRGRVRISISGVPVYENGEFVGYRGVGRDISKEQQHAEELRRALVLAEQANHTKSEFLATMSHELRTPLNAILGFSEMIREEVYGKLGSSVYKEYINHIHSSGRHLLELINEVLDISAIEAGKRKIDLEPVNVQGILDDCITFLSYDAGKRKVTVETHTEGRVRDIALDRTSIKQIFLNVIANAVKYNKTGGKVDIGLVFADDFVTLTVADTGIGIPEDSLAIVTEPFVRAQSNPHLTQEGTGLGLAIVKHLIEAHGGTLTIESVEYVGTTVTIVLPIVEVAEARKAGGAGGD